MSFRDTVDAVFLRLTAGDLSAKAGPLQDGWEVELPSRMVVARSTLQREAGSLIALGADAVPALLRWVDDDNVALRYVAVYALQRITGEEPDLPVFDAADRVGRSASAVKKWRRWYDDWKAREP